MRGEGRKENRWWCLVVGGGGGVAERITSERKSRKGGWRRRMVWEPRNVDLFRTRHAAQGVGKSQYGQGVL